MHSQPPPRKTAVVIFSDPKTGGEESLGLLFNALALSHKAKQAGDEVAILSAIVGTRWPAELARLDHPAHEIYRAVRENVQGASCGCAAVFGSTESVQAAGVPLVRDYTLPGTPGVLSIRRYATEGWTTFVF